MNCLVIHLVEKERLRSEAELLRKTILKRDKNRCLVCGEKRFLEVHHMKAIYLGGDSDPSNLVTVCKVCHNYAPETSTKDFEEYRKNPGENVLNRLLASDESRSVYNELNFKFFQEITQEYVGKGFINESQANKIMLYEIGKLIIFDK